MFTMRWPCLNSSMLQPFVNLGGDEADWRRLASMSDVVSMWGEIVYYIYTQYLCIYIYIHNIHIYMYIYIIYIYIHYIYIYIIYIYIVFVYIYIYIIHIYIYIIFVYIYIYIHNICIYIYIYYTYIYIHYIYIHIIFVYIYIYTLYITLAHPEGLEVVSHLWASHRVHEMPVILRSHRSSKKGMSWNQDVSRLFFLKQCSEWSSSTISKLPNPCLLDIAQGFGFDQGRWKHYPPALW